MGITLISCGHFILLLSPLLPCSGFILVDNTMSPCRINLLDWFIITLTVGMKFLFCSFRWEFLFFGFSIPSSDQRQFTLRLSHSDDTVAARIEVTIHE